MLKMSNRWKEESIEEKKDGVLEKLACRGSSPGAVECVPRESPWGGQRKRKARGKEEKESKKRGRRWASKQVSK